MIISHRHKFIFFAVPKTATHTIREALRAHLASDDWEQQVLFGKQQFPIPEIAAIQHGHISAQQIRWHIEPDIWKGYFKFAIVRNPYDRFVSTCFFLNRDNPDFSASAFAFMKDRLPRARFQQRVLVRPQFQQLTNSNGELVLDFIGRYEDLQNSYDVICERIGIPHTKLGEKNASKHTRFVDYYDDELRQAVSEFYADDLRLFDYRFPES